MTLECSVARESDRSVTVTVRGDIDLATAADFEACVRGTLSGASSIVIDLEGVTFLDSSGLRSFVKLQEDTRPEGAALTLRGTPKNVRRVFDLTGLTEKFTFSDE